MALKEEEVQGRSTWICCIKVYLKERKQNNEGQHNAICRFPCGPEAPHPCGIENIIVKTRNRQVQHRANQHH